ncbi:MAG: hypothetical protein QW552_04990 [Ignisphaera sp.]|uniref:Uncharacterized protein n=1 Tax=Ignisphaera aggregans TaxID=334771 RepID=A0A7C4NKT9_9CREN
MERALEVLNLELYPIDKSGSSPTVTAFLPLKELTIKCLEILCRENTGLYLLVTGVTSRQSC